MTEEMRRLYLDTMGIDVWLSRSTAAAQAIAPVAARSNSITSTLPGKVSEPPRATETKIDQAESADWHRLANEIKQCQACGLAEQRTNTVVGSGARNADWLIIGEAPNQEEEQQGEPFIDASGSMLDQMLFALGLQREQVYITNIVKCRPPQKRDLRVDELASCATYLQRQIALLQPKIIVVLGRVAAQSILASSSNIGDLRGSTHHYPNTQIPMVIAYHPAYLLRKPLDKRKMWQDLQYAYQVYSQISRS